MRHVDFEGLRLFRRILRKKVDFGVRGHSHDQVGSQRGEEVYLFTALELNAHGLALQIHYEQIGAVSLRQNQQLACRENLHVFDFLLQVQGKDQTRPVLLLLYLVDQDVSF